MKRKFLITLMSLICVLSFAFGLTACGDTTTPDDSGGTHTHIYVWTDNNDGTHKQHCSVSGCDAPDINIENHVWGKDNKCEKCKAAKPNKEPTWTSKVYDEFVANMVVKGNYLYTVTENGKTDSYDIHGKVVRYREKGDRRGVYWYTENDIGYQIKYNENDSMYHKIIAEKVYADSIILDSLKSATLSSYDDTTKKYTVSLGGVEYQMSVSSNSLEFVNNSKTFTVSEVGQITVELPAERFIVDDTNKEQPEHQHVWSQIWSKNDTYHWHNCTADGCDIVDNTLKAGYAEHDFTNGNCVCGKEKPIEPHSHVWSQSWANNETHHWHNCTADGCNIVDNTQKDGYAEHNFANGNCVCGKEKATLGLEYSLNYDNKSYTVTGIGTATDKDIIIPKEYNGKSVTSIGEGAFSGCTSLTSIMIPEGVTNIGEGAFYNCTSFTSISIPNSIIMCGCMDNLSLPYKVYNHGMYLGNGENPYLVLITSDTSVSSFTIHTNTKVIADNAFYYRKNLTSITIPYGVTGIGDDAFKYCSELTSISIPDSIIRIGNDAFYGCTKLQYNIYENLKYLGNSSNKYLVFIAPRYTAITNYVLNEKTKVICSNAFSSVSVSSIVIPSGVTHISDKAFYDCRELGNIKVDVNNATYVGDGSALFNKAQTELLIASRTLICFTIPKSVTSISSRAFYGCDSLTSITIGNSVTHIGYEAFNNCSNLTSIYYTGDISSWCSISGSWFEPSSKIYINGKELTKELIGELIIPDGVTNIGGQAFRGCSGLTSITIPNGVTSIGSQAFEGCSGLTSITIPDSVTSIGSQAFEGCSGLTSITIPNGVTSIGNSAFRGCSVLTSITIPDSVTSIGSHAFEGCSGLTSITIPDSITSIDYSAFRDCSGLTNITIPNGVTSIGSQAFEGCSGLTSITIPNSVTSIGSHAFNKCSGLTSITIPNSVTSIGDLAFAGCSGLTSITVANGNAKYRSAGNCLIETTSKTLILGCKNSVIPTDSSVTSIGGYAFYNCSGLTDITIPNSVTKIGDSAFRHCNGLMNITIPNSVTSIENYAFHGCGGLMQITFNGIMTQWKAITKGSDWNLNTGTYIVICTNGRLDKNGDEIN